MNEEYKYLSYDDVLLVPRYSDVISRKMIDVGTSLDTDINLDLPIISSPMDTVTEADMAVAMALNGGLGIIHRYNSVQEQADMTRSAAMTLAERQSSVLVGAAVGVVDDYLSRAAALVDAGAILLCVDIAHGHHILMERALKSLKDTFGEAVHIMAGNVATVNGVEDLADWGADSVRCGIGGGSICSTRIQTGHGVPNFSMLVECVNARSDVAIIADGGIKNSGDIVKALAAGADAVMLGSLLAGAAEAPGKRVGGKKEYRGMASRSAQMDWRGRSNAAEGVAATVPVAGEVAEVLGELRGGIASGFSYSGCRDLQDLWDKAAFVVQTAAGQRESSTHILGR
mgnify:CR=1 FL=1